MTDFTVSSALNYLADQLILEHLPDDEATDYTYALYAIEQYITALEDTQIKVNNLLASLSMDDQGDVIGEDYSLVDEVRKHSLYVDKVRTPNG